MQTSQITLNQRVIKCEALICNANTCGILAIAFCFLSLLTPLGAQQTQAVRAGLGPEAADAIEHA